MSRQTQKILSILLSLTLCCSLLPVSAFAEEGPETEVSPAVQTGDPEISEPEEPAVSEQTDAEEPEALLSETSMEDLPVETDEQAQPEGKPAAGEIVTDETAKEANEITASEEPDEVTEEAIAAETEEIQEEAAEEESADGEAADEEPAEENVKITEVEDALPRCPVLEDRVTAEGFTEEEDLLDGYARKQLENALPGRMLLQALPPSVLNGMDEVTAFAFYTLKEMIAETAAGGRPSTVYTVDFSALGDSVIWTPGDFWEQGPDSPNGSFDDYNIDEACRMVMPSLNSLMSALLVACPYELYWFNKTIGVVCLGPEVDENGVINKPDIYFEYTDDMLELRTITYRFAVSPKYEKSEYRVITTYAETVFDAVRNARAIVGRYTVSSDYGKLLGYKNEICRLTTYNSSAPGTTYSDPWQLIWVFDGDPSTNVVCEGYAKAFQYLCDMSAFSSDLINCYCVTGRTSGHHMWNIVTMEDGQNYLIDVTNCDISGNTNRHFLKGTTSYREIDGYRYAYTVGGISYTYDSYAELLYSAEELNLSEADYPTPDHVHMPGEPVRENQTVHTKEENGGYDEVIYCVECGAELSRIHIETGHVGIIKNDKSPTFEEDGYTGDTVCSICGEILETGIFIPRKEIREEPEQILLAGKYLILSSKAIPIPSPIWSFVEEDASQSATLTQTGRITAKKVTAQKLVTVMASDSDDSFRILFPIRIVPAATAVIVTDGEGIAVGGKTVEFDLNSDGESIRFHAATLPDEAMNDVRWTSSDSAKKQFAADYTQNGGDYVVSRPTGKTGSVTLTAKAADGSGRSAAVTLKLVRYATSLSITSHENGTVLYGGQSITLKTDIALQAGLTDRTLTWSLSDESVPYASINNAGKLTTRAVFEPTEIRATARAKSGSAADITITLLPTATEAVIRDSDGNRLAKNQLLYLPMGETLLLSGAAWPEEAMQGGTWTSSNKAVASIAGGQVTPLKQGSVTLTYRTADGKRNTSVKLQVVSMLTGMFTLDPAEGELLSGKTLQITAASENGSVLKAGNLIWESSDKTVATVSTSGKVTAKTATVPVPVIITARAKDGSGEAKAVALTVKPVKNTASVWLEGNNVTGKTVSIAITEGGCDLTAQLYHAASGITAAPEEIIWTSSNKTVATVDGEGHVSFGQRTGSAAITAQYGKLSAKVTLKTYQPVESIALMRKSGGLTPTEGATALVSGKSLQLTAAIQPTDATIKSVTWGSSDESIAAVSSSGKVTAKTVYTQKTVTITATAKDGSNKQDNFLITVYPAATWICIRDGSGRVMNNRIESMATGDDLQLTAAVYPNPSGDGALQNVIWKSGNAKAVTVDENGLIHILKTGTAKITATASDGSGKSVSFTIKVG